MGSARAFLSLIFFLFFSQQTKETELGLNIGVLATSKVLLLNEMMLFHGNTEPGAGDSVLH